MCFKLKKIIRAAVSVLFCIGALANIAAQNVTVSLATLKQTIKGYGGMNHTTWISDLTDSQRTTAFGNGAGQLGLSILRIHVDESSSNWSKEVATAQRAVALGATVFASPWNPPASMKSGGKLMTSQYSAYADHLNSFVSYMKQNGVDLYAISVQNEPDYASDWTAWTATDIVNFLKNNSSVIQCRIMAPESFQYVKSMSDPILNDAAALANLDILAAHLYGTPLSNYPYPLFKQKGAGKELWMTEVYTDSTTDANSWPNALDVAYNIHNSMVEAEFNAYVWWYIRRSYGFINDSGQVTKRGYCMAQFSKFIRPGYVRVDATKNPTTDVYVSAYKNDQNAVVVVVNRSSSAKTLNLSINGGTVLSLTKYTTSGSKSVNNDGTVSASGTFSLSVDAQSVTTFVGSLSGTTVTPTPTATPTATPTPTPTQTVLVTPTPQQNPIWTGGPYTLDGTSSYIDLPDNITGNLGDFSVACSVKLNSVTNWVRIFDFGGSQDVFMMLTPQSGTTGYPYFAITLTGNEGEQGLNGTAALPTGTWQHIAVVKSGNTGILYINKQEVARNTGMTLRPADLGTTTNNYIGKSQWAQDPYLNASVDKFVFYNRALSAAEVFALPEAGGGLTGDVNGDGMVTIVDAMLIAQHVAGMNPSGFIVANADTNCDNTVNINDALLVARYAAGLLTSLGCQSE
jgi:glucuronoarabinoxylan endo-1,4-beta-xylanase